MPDPQDTPQIEGLPPGAVLKPIQQSAPQIEGLPPGAVLKPIGGTPPSQPMVTNSAGETMPADVAARHALTRVGKDQPQPQGPGMTSLALQATGLPASIAGPAGEVVNKVGEGAVKEAGKTAYGVADLLSGGAASQGVTAPEAKDFETHGALETVGGLAEQGTEWAAGDAALEAIARAAKLVKYAPHMVDFVENYPKLSKFLKGSAKAATVGAAQGAVKESAPGGEGAVKGAEHGAEAGGAGGVVGEIAGAVTKPVLNKLGLATSSIEDAMRAAQPGKRNTKFIEDWQTAAPRLVKELDEGGKFENMEDAANRIRDVRQGIWNDEVKPVIEKHANEIVDTTPVAKAVRDLSEKTALKKNFPEDAKKLADFANKYTSGSPLFDGDRSVKDIEEEIELYNGKLSEKGFWRKSASEKAALMKANPEIAAWKTASDTMRDTLYNHLENVSKEPGVKDLKKTYGAVANVENEVRGQVNVASRQRPLSMKQIIGLTAGIVHSGPAGLVAAALPIIDKFYNSPEELLNRAIPKSAPAGPVKKVVQEVTNKATQNAGALGGFTGANGVLMLTPDGQAFSVHPDDVDKAKQIGYKPVESTPEKP